MRCTLCIFSIVLWMAGAAEAHVLTVGSGGDYVEIQAAVDAAQDGDTLLIYPGTYGSVLIQAKGLSLAADGAGVIVKGSLVVEDLPASSTLVVVGLELSAPSFTYDGPGPILLENNHGSVRIEECTCTGKIGYAYYYPPTYYIHPATPAVHVVNCSDTAFMRCSLKGGAGREGNYTFSARSGKSGLIAEASTVALFDSTLQGGHGGDDIYVDYAGHGGNGLMADDDFCVLFASGCHMVGGDGGDGKSAGGSGGDGLYMDSLTKARLLNNLLEGGEGGLSGYPGGNGYPGQPIFGGQVLHMPGKAHTFEMPCPVRVNEQVTLTMTGKAGNRMAIFISLFTESQFMPGWGGQLLIGMNPLPALVILGSIPASGTVSWPLTVPEQGSAFTDLTGYIQPIFGDPTTGQLTLGTLRSLVVLDDTY